MTLEIIKLAVAQVKQLIGLFGFLYKFLDFRVAFKQLYSKIAGTELLVDCLVLFERVLDFRESLFKVLAELDMHMAHHGIFPLVNLYDGVEKLVYPLAGTADSRNHRHTNHIAQRLEIENRA